jgi:GT2 family glycosyltransferase
MTAGIAALNAGLALDADHVGLLSSLAVAQLNLEDYVAAQRYAARALAVDPDHKEAMLCRARAELKLGNSNLAAIYIESLLWTGYKQHEVLLLQIDVLSEQGDHEAAVLSAAELCETYPESVECLTSFRRAFRAFQQSPARYIDFLAALKTPWFPAKALTHKQNFPADQVRIDVIIPVHNGLRQVKACLDSVLGHSGARLGKLILVNDDSAPDTVQALTAYAKARADTVLVQTMRRSGFTGAVLRGLAESDAPAFVVLNSDTVVPNGWLDRLYGALRSSDRPGMVSPMSNNATWQNYAVLAQNGIPDPAEWDRLARIGQGFCPASLAPLPILHGFCILVDRRAYDLIGGFDLNAYPEGYGETQDLSLRMISANLDLFVVTDCIVYHEQGGSISERRRENLTLSARKKLYETYSALNYLCLEMACYTDPVLSDVRKIYAGDS